MAKLMWIVGILMVALGVALGLMIFFSPVSIVGWGVTPDTAALFLVGGFLSLGLGGVIDALANLPARAAAAAEQPYAAPAPANIPEFGRRGVEVVAASAAVEVVTETVSPAVKETIEALEQAKKDLSQAFDEKPAAAAATVAVAESVEAVAAPVPAAEPEAELQPEDEPAAEEGEEAPDDDQLYVVEERSIRNRPARILSDGTVEAETEEGWMRFENLEHLDEYLDAMSPPART